MDDALIFSVTEMMGFLRCRSQWDMTSLNRLALQPIVGAPHFLVGQCAHESLAKWANSPELNLQEIYREYSNAHVYEIIKNYTERVGMKPSAAEMLPTFEALDLGSAMMANYQLFYKTPLPEGWHPETCEQTIVVPIPGSEHSLECTFDGLIVDTSNQYAIREYKTYGSRPRADMLTKSFQFIAYMWAFMQLDIGPLIGLAYDGMWKRAEPPKNSVMADLFHREILTRTTQEIKHFERTLVQIVYEMGAEPAIYETVPWNGCFDCHMKSLCDARMSNSQSTFDLLVDTRYTKRVKTSAYEDD